MHFFNHRKKSNWIILGTVAVGLIVLFFFLQRMFDVEALKEKIQTWNGFMVFGVMAILPIIGLSVSVVYLIAGAKFGTMWGLVVVGCAIAIHLLATYWISKGFLRKPLERFFAKRKYKLPEVPEGDYAAITVLAALIPGLP